MNVIPEQRPSSPPAWLGLVLIAVASCLAYGPAVRGQFLWDDDAHVTKPALQSAAGLYRIWFDVGATQQYYPLLHSAFWFQHQLFGDSPLGYHLINLLLHLIATGLVYGVLRRLQIPGAMLAAAIFALHPVQVETVAWITEQKNTLSTMFYLGAMLSYLRFDATRQKLWYAAALGLFGLAVTSKTVTATLPAALLVIFWWQRGRLHLAAGANDPPRLSWRRDVLPLVPFFIVGGAFGLLTAWVEHHLIGAQGDDYNLSITGRILLAGRVIWFYLGKLAWPTELIFFYPRWTVDPTQLWQWMYPLGAVAMTVALWAIRRRWRAPLAAWLFFVGTLFPALGFVNVYPFKFSFVADHFQYLACLGPIVLASAGLTLALERAADARWVATAVPVALLAVLTLLTRQQSEMYRDAETLYRATLERNPSCWLVQNNLGVILAFNHQLPEGIQHLEESLRLKPDYADAHLNLGHALIEAGRTEEAIAHCLEATRITPEDSDAWNNLGSALISAGKFQEALEPLDRAVLLNPDSPEPYNNRGNALLNLGRPDEAIESFNKSLALRPNFAQAEHNLRLALVRAGRAQEAIDYFLKEVQRDPTSAKSHYDLGNALLACGRLDDAVQQFEQALRLKPDDVDARLNLGVALEKAGRGTEAIAQFEGLLQAHPNLAEAHNNLGNALRQVGQPEAALSHLQQAVRLKPDYLEAWGNLAFAEDQLQHPAEAVAAAQKALEIARAQGSTTVVPQIEAWLKSHDAGSAPSPRP